MIDGKAILDKMLDESIHSSNPVRRAKAVGHVRRLMREPLRAHEASAKLHKHVDDQKMHTEIEYFKKLDPQTDVRPVVKAHMRKHKIEGF